MMRKLHYLDYSAYEILEEAFKTSFSDIINGFEEADRELAKIKLTDFYVNLRNEGVIKFVDADN